MERSALQLIAALDIRAYVFFGRMQERLNLYPLARALSSSGDGYLYLAIGLLAWVLAPQAGGGALLLCGLLAAAIDLPLYVALKKLFKRRRPYMVHSALQRIHIPSDEFSFPSGHATGGFMVAYLIGYFFPVLSAPMYAWVTLVALSRVLLRVHFISDLVAGALLGSGIALLALNLAEILGAL
ncbi:MAG: phosphatase PAP2 family protein [Cellvibrionales bacterium]|nr:phosphatase PAP2 family protein [Cellvibrionales bacterium]